MKTNTEIEKQKNSDVQFIISAVTSELHELARLQYFEEWEQNGGMGWFFNECVSITHEIMFTEGSKYLEWLSLWINTPDGEECEGFSELFVSYSACFDWYHMDEARALFESRYSKDEDPTEEISEHIGDLINLFDTDTQRNAIVDLSVKYAKDIRKKSAKHLAKEKLQNIIKELKAIEVDGESMEYIISEVGMTEQMIKQLK